MAAFDPATLDRWRALAIVDRDGTTVGTITEFYLDRETGHPTWALVNTGLFGTSRTFVPLVHATEISDGLQVPYEKRHIKDSPQVDLHDELSPEEEATLFAHYGVEYEPVAEEPPATAPEAPGSAAPVSVVTAEPVDEVEPGLEVAAEPAGEADPGSAVAAEPGTAEGPGPVPAVPTAEGSGSVATSSEAAEGLVPAPADPGAAEAPGPVPAEPGTDEPTGGRDGSGSAATDDDVPDEPGTADPDEATRVDQQGLRSEMVEPDGPGSTAQEHEASTEGDADLSRTAPVEPGLPGSTAADPYGPVPTTIDKGTDPAEQPADETTHPQEDAGWPPASAPAGSFEEQVPLDRPAGSSDRWREAKLAAERDRAARPPAQPEERSPLERARRRLERLVGVGQEHTDPEDVSPADRDAADRTRPGVDEGDNHQR